MEGESSDITLFLGRFHPLVLHLPIGFLTLAFLLEVFSRFRPFAHFKSSVAFVLLLGCCSAVVASVFGYMLALSGGYNEDMLSIHQWTGIGVSVGSMIALLLQWRYKRSRAIVIDRFYLATLSAMMLSLAVAGHYGGSLTHGSDYLSEHMPDGLRRLTGMAPKEEIHIPRITNLDEAVVYADIIDPIFKTYCTSCHNPDKSKGDLMMHTPDHLLKGGENGAVIIFGDAGASPLIQRTQLPENDDDHMPPEGKRQPSQDQLDLLVWWVNAGAPFDKKVADLNVPEEVKTILEKLVDPVGAKGVVDSLLASEVRPADEQVLSRLRAHGVSIAPLSSEIHWLQANVSASANVDSLMSLFLKVSEQLTWLNLGGSQVTDKSLAVISGFKNLTRLHLGNTEVTDAGLQHLKNLSYLETLNLYGTSVTDDGIQQLGGLKNLKTLYLWQTGVTADGAARLQELIPGIQINLGLQVTSIK